jgi:hypothetical protein
MAYDTANDDTKDRKPKTTAPSKGAKGKDSSLAAHTPSPEYTTASLVQRAMELLGADKQSAEQLVPTPYVSKYPHSEKLLDAMLTLALDPIVKPMSLRGDLPKNPLLSALSDVLADRGYFQRYPGGGIGIGGGGGSAGDSASADAGGPGIGMGEGDIGFGPATSDIGQASPATAAMGGVIGALGLGPTSPSSPTGFSAVTGTPTSPAGEIGLSISGPGTGISASDPGPSPTGDLGIGAEGSTTMSISDISKAADVAPFTNLRLRAILRALSPFGSDPAEGTDIGAAAGTFSKMTSLGGGLGIPGAGLLGPFAKVAAADAVQRATDALTKAGFSANPISLNAVIAGMTGPSGPDASQAPSLGDIGEAPASAGGPAQTARAAGTRESDLPPELVAALSSLQSRGSSLTNPWQLAEEFRRVSPGTSLESLLQQAQSFMARR